MYVRCSVPVLMSRIEKRGRPEEKDMPVQFVEDIQRRHDRWLNNSDTGSRHRAETGTGSTPVLVLDGDLELDDFKAELRRRMREILGGKIDII